MFEVDRSNQNNPSTHHARFRFLEENWKYQMPVRTKDLDEAIAEVIGTFEGVEEIIALLRLYSKERHIGSLADPSRWKITAVPVTSVVKRGSAGNTRLLSPAKMLLVPMNFFSAG